MITLRDLTLSRRGRYHTETSPLICYTNQWTGFYMIMASVLKGLSKGWYVTASGIPFILWFSSLFFGLKLENLTLFISDLIWFSGYSLFLNHDFISILWSSKSFFELHNLLIRRVWLKTTHFLVWYEWADK